MDALLHLMRSLFRILPLILLLVLPRVDVNQTHKFTTAL
jgi:hypothetical protein